MPYATQDDLVALRRLTPTQLLQLTTDPGADEPDPDVIALALADASAKVDSYCGQRYALPLTASRLVVVATVDLAVYILYGGKALSDRDPAAIRYAETMAFLKDVSSGKASLDQEDAPLNPQLAAGGVVIPEKPQTFCDRGLEGYL